MFITVGRYCKFTQSVGDSNLCEVPSKLRPVFGRVNYSFSIEIPSVYIGPHKDGYLISLNLRITRIHFEPNIDDLIKICIEPPLPEDKSKAKRRRKHVVPL